MNKLILSSLTILFICLSTMSTNFCLPKSTSMKRNLIWSDEFCKNTLDPMYWSLQEGSNIWGNNELEYYTTRSDNCIVEDGKLKIIAKNEDYKNSQYTSARVTTKDKFDFLYGKLDIKAKLPKGRGLLPAIWMLPVYDTYNDREKNGEIDIMEMPGDDANTVYGFAHYYSDKTYTFFSSTYNDNKTDFSDDFHVFSLEWNENEMRWLVDNKVLKSFNLSKNFTDSYNPFNKKFYLIINLAVGGDWPENPNNDTKFPSIMEIEYVRYYR